MKDQIQSNLGSIINQVYKLKEVLQLITSEKKLVAIYTLLYYNMLTSRVAQWKRAGPITQRSEDRNLALLKVVFLTSITP